MLAACELDAVDIAAPREMHAPLVRLAAKKHLPVLCQKPLAPNLREATDLANEVSDLTRLMVHENWRFRGYYRDAAAWLREGRIGNVKQVQLTLLTSGVLPGPDGPRIRTVVYRSAGTRQGGAGRRPQPLRARACPANIIHPRESRGKDAARASSPRSFQARAALGSNRVAA